MKKYLKKLTIGTIALFLLGIIAFYLLILRRGFDWATDSLLVWVAAILLVLPVITTFSIIIKKSIDGRR